MRYEKIKKIEGLILANYDVFFMMWAVVQFLLNEFFLLYLVGVKAFLTQYVVEGSQKRILRTY